MNYDKTTKFTRDFKKLLKKFSLLADDLKVAKKNAIEIFHIHKIDNKSIFEIQNAGNTEKLQFYKIKKFACKNLKGRGIKSGIRVVYAFFPIQQKIIFLEIYFKAKQKNENKQRIEDFIETTNNNKS